MGYNMKHAGVKRLMREAIEMKEPTDLYYAQPIDDENLFEWHFTVRGPPDTEFEEGIYHGRISFPPDYPMKPPSIFVLTKNGRFEVNKKICLSISGYHPETWLPSWSIRTALLAIIGFMPSKGEGAVGSLDYSPAERRSLAKYSIYFKCAKCGVHCGNILKPMQASSEKSRSELQEAKTLVENQYKPSNNQGSSQPSSSKPTAAQSNVSHEDVPQTLPSTCASNSSNVSKSNLALETKNSYSLSTTHDLCATSSSACNLPMAPKEVSTTNENKVTLQGAIKPETSQSGDSKNEQHIFSTQEPNQPQTNGNPSCPTRSRIATSNSSAVLTQRQHPPQLNHPLPPSERRQQSDSIPLIVSAFVVFVAIIVLVLRRASMWDLGSSDELQKRLSQP